jgi:hypothetical protein
MNAGIAAAALKRKKVDHPSRSAIRPAGADNNERLKA